jgi:excisionase family DNA binding protein
MPNQTIPTALTIKQAAPYLGVAERTLRIMLNEGKIRGFKVGTRGPKSQWRITTSEIARYTGEGVTANA